ncbi:MAG: hypothetical protein GOV15_02365 [Candidatus Diapherotrites archaeon]|nr:hypothetical protein [Candidatus Diapherotrites archaeon]
MVKASKEEQERIMTKLDGLWSRLEGPSFRDRVDLWQQVGKEKGLNTTQLNEFIHAVRAEEGLTSEGRNHGLHKQKMEAWRPDFEKKKKQINLAARRR